ncbi:MAG: hypothetical protein IPM06_21810 [Rhizobiales bacterium]|nr:hypothetical protein [Hyphomicrobiales bacterium]
MDVIVVDIETYYAADYTLSNMTTEAYVRDGRFEEILLGVKMQQHQGVLAATRPRRRVPARSGLRTTRHSFVITATLMASSSPSPRHPSGPAIDTLSMARA